MQIIIIDKLHLIIDINLSLFIAFLTFSIFLIIVFFSLSFSFFSLRLSLFLFESFFGIKFLFLEFLLNFFFGIFILLYFFDNNGIDLLLF